VVPLKNKDTRCSLCSLACFLRLSQSPHGYLEPDYREDVPELRRGVCNRGNMTAELLGHIRRIDAARFCGEVTRQVPLDEAIHNLAGTVRSSRTTLLIDGNLPGEDIAAGLALAAASGGKIAAGVYLPTEDEMVLEGLAASKAKLLTPENLVECDAILIVGDAFATHPVISKPVHALRKRNVRTPLVVVDSLPGRTSIFATHPLMVKPGTESRVLAALAGKSGVAALGSLSRDVAQAASESGLPEGVLAAAAAAVAGAKRLGVIVRAEIGKAANWDQTGLLSGLIASAKAGGVTACLTYGNALGAYRLARAARAKLDKPGETVIVLGTDVVSVLSKQECNRTLDGIRTLVAAAQLPTLTLGAADVVLPLAFNFEAGGTTVTGSGEVITVDSLAEAPGEAVPAGELVMKLADALGLRGVERKVDRRLLEEMPEVDSRPILERGQPEVAKAREREFLAVTESDAIHFHTGGRTSQCEWPRYMVPNPVVTMNLNDAQALGIATGDEVLLVSSEGEGRATAEVVKGQTAGVVAVSSGFAEMRGLFPWNMARRTGPVAVRIQKAGRET
jgi:anaerobic selenocysteine-containing dehydrogenase